VFGPTPAEGEGSPRSEGVAHEPDHSRALEMPSAAERVHPVPPTWAVVLAGGDGVRLRPLVRRLFGHQRPKQYVPLLGPDSLLRQTLKRVGRFIPPERTVVVTRAEHAPYIATELPDGPAPHVILLPEDRGTGAAVLFAAYRIREWDPGATLAFFPSDHFILEEDAFLLHVRKIAAFVARNLERLVLLAARPTAPESDYGWVKPGTPLGESTDNPMYQVQAFLEKPQRENAERRLAAGWLWNTFAFVTSLPTLLDVGRELLPSVDARLQLIGGFARSRHEGWAIRQAYALIQPSDFSSGVLERKPSCLAVSALPRLTWSDLGTPRRVVDVASKLPVRPAWLDAERSTMNILSSVLHHRVRS
jgi:mannose-1-phosphate guanylyltransferase